MEYLYEKENYLTPDKYVSGNIVEYDMEKANINMLLRAGVIDQNYYNFLSYLPKREREIEVGKLHFIYTPEKGYPSNYISTVISEELKKYRKLLFESNNLKDEEIVRIAKDAIFVLRSYNLSQICFDGVVFRPKLVASAMLNLNKILIFSKYNNLDQIEIEVKGLGNNDIYHQNGILVIIANTMYIMERVSLKDALLYVQETYKQYINKELPIEYYREFNSFSCFKLIDSDLSPMFLDEKYKDIVDISYNINFLRELYSIVFNLYMIHNRL
jgi:hypothetical protein